MKLKFTMSVFVACVAAVVSLTASAQGIVVGIADMCRNDGHSEALPDYSASVYASGATPCVLPCTTNSEAIAALLDCVDMLLLAGGEDVEPVRFGETPAPKLGKVNLRRDAWEFALVAEARKRRMPIFGICRGCQVLNVAFGGTLWQDLQSQKEGALVHRLKGQHAIAVEKGSYLAELTGEACSVNSRHHQAVKDVAKGFRVTALSPDGVVEAIEGADYPAVGVQFHPEMMFAKSGRREFLPLFRGAFAKIAPRVAAARRRKLVLIPDYCFSNRVTRAKYSMSDAVISAGFVGAVLPFCEDKAKLAAAVAEADAMMVGGGMDGQDYKRRCAFEYLVLDPAVKRGIPIAGVCHGMQHINVFLGGKLLPTRQKQGETAPDVVIHTHKDHPVFHEAELVPGSRIARVMGAAKYRVNSWHTLHSATLGPGLKVTARAPDGVIEAYEHETLPVMAFQFHPELMTDDPHFIELVREALSNPAEGRR